MEQKILSVFVQSLGGPDILGLYIFGKWGHLDASGYKGMLENL